jgi:hypothetical protein
METSVIATRNGRTPDESLKFREITLHLALSGLDAKVTDQINQAGSGNLSCPVDADGPW